jgi:phage terminase large subunit-like protein
MTNYIYEYYQAIKDGTIVVGQWVAMWYEYVIKGLETKAFFYDARKANRAIKFVETFCHHHEGALAPNLISLELWQKALVSVVFGIVDDKGMRQFREVFVVVGRKNGKTLLASAIANYMMFLDGERGARIYFVAPKLEQANLCFDALVQMINQEPELKAITKKRRTDLYVESTNTTSKPLAFNAKKSDGLNPSCCVADEVASWSGDQGLKQYEVIKSAMGARRQPLILSISTAGYVDEGIFDELVKRSTAVINGDSRETRLAPFLYMIDDISKWNDINELRKANPNLGVSVSVDYMLEEIAIAEGSLSKKVEFLTKYCNIKQNSSQAWLPTQDINGIMGAPLNLDDFKGHYCVLGIDLSRTTDLTAAVCVIQKNDDLFVFSKMWLPSEKIEEASIRDNLPYKIYIQRGLLAPSGDNVVDYNDCFNWCRELVEKYKLYPQIVGYDRYNAAYLTQQLDEYGFKCDDVAQGFNCHPAIAELEGLIKDGKLHLGDNDLLKVHFLDTALKFSAEKERSRIVKLTSTSHIDGVAALVCAMIVRQKWWSEYGGRLRNERR